jgi:hypothetical protein
MRLSHQASGRFLLAVIAGLLAMATAARGEDLRFLAFPYKVNEGDAVTFQYLDQKPNTLNRTNIASWEWDFDGDGVIDARGQAPADGSPPNLNGVWFAKFDRNRAVAGAYRVVPRLFVETRDGRSLAETNGVTEDVVGLQTVNIGAGNLPNQVDRDAEVIVEESATGNTDLKAHFGTAQRLVVNGTAVRFNSEVELLRPGKILSIDWDFTGGTNFTVLNVASPTHVFPSTSFAQDFDVAMRVRYAIRTNASDYIDQTPLVRVLPACVRVVPELGPLSAGRAYRRGFPETYDWDDLVQAYSAASATGDRHVYFHLLERALTDLQQTIRQKPDGPTADDLRQLAEVANELLQGQLLIGNQRLISALRIRYPRITDPNELEERLPAPPGVREEVAGIEVALLEYQAALFHFAAIVREFGPGLLRSKAAPGREPFPDFPRYLTFEDPSLAQKPLPLKNEWWQLSYTLSQMGLGQMEKAKKLFRLSLQDAVARVEAKEECKRAGLQGYLGMALLAAGQSTNDFALNEGNNLLAHLKNARDLFETINQGRNPLRNDGSFIPNESFTAIYQDAQESVTDAKGMELEARSEKREFDQRQATLRNELLSQRTSYITPLKLLTGIDPAQYNNLQTVQDQNDFRATVRNRIQNILRDYPNTSASGAGEMGGAVLAVLDSAQNVQQRINDLNNLYRNIDIKKWANQRVANTVTGFAEQYASIDLFLGIQEGMMQSVVGTSFSPASIVAGIQRGILNAAKNNLQALQQVTVGEIQLEAETRGILLEVGNLGIAIDRSNNQLDQARLALENAEARMDRLIEDLANTRATAENLYFTDPSFRVVVSRAQRRAEDELDYAVDRLYRLAKTLQYEWTEPYENPLVIPVQSLETAALENPLFDKFTQLDSVFNVRSADEAKDYLDALRAWDSKLRRINLISVRGPNHAGPYSAEPISLREQVFNFRPMTLLNGDGSIRYSATLADSIRQFRDFLGTNRVKNPQNPGNPSLELKFATTIEDNRFFPATGAEWNMRIAGIRVDLVGDSGINGSQVAEVDLTQSGLVSLRRFFAEPPAADDLFKLTFNAGDRIDRSAFTIKVPARINGATGGRPPGEFEAGGLQGRPVAATDWILRIDTAKPANRNFDFTKLKDIVVRFTYTYGNPPEFPGF